LGKRMVLITSVFGWARTVPTAHSTCAFSPDGCPTCDWMLSVASNGANHAACARKLKQLV